MASVAGPSTWRAPPPHLRVCARQVQKQSRRFLTQSTAPPRRLAFAFDIDGVLKQGKIILPQAKRILAHLSGKSGKLKRPIPFILMTNSGGSTEAERCRALSADFEVEIGPDQLVQSHTPLQRYVSDYADKPVLVLGCRGDAARRIAESYGLRNAYILQDLLVWNPAVWDRYTLSDEERSYARPRVDFSQTPIHAVIVLHDNGLDWAAATQVICELLMSENGVMGTKRRKAHGQNDGKEIPLILTNPDVVWKTEYPQLRFGMGGFRVGLEAVYNTLTGAQLPFTQFGKPHAATYDFTEEMLRHHLRRLDPDSTGPIQVYMVGDNPESDIAGANGHGWASILVRTGVYADGDELAHKPTFIADDVEQGVLAAIERETAGT